jgi:DNA primase
MSDWVDYKQLKTQISFKAVVEYYQLHFNTKGDELVGICPLPDHAGDRDNKNAFHISLDKNCYNCLTHCGGGNVIDFIRLMEKLPDDKEGFRKAAIFLQEKFNIMPDNPKELKTTKSPAAEKKQEDEKEPTKNEPLTFSLENRIKKDHPFLLEEKGLPIEFIKKFGLGWCKAGLMAGRIVIPIHNTTGELIAYAGRALTDADEERRGKYLFPTGFNKSLELWNYHRVLAKKKLIRDRGLIVVEGFFDAIKLILNGFSNVVALMGWSMSEQQEELILSITDKIAIFLDNDDAGKEATKKIHKRLIYKAFIKVVPYPDDESKTQPEDFDKKELTNLLGYKKGEHT